MSRAQSCRRRRVRLGTVRIKSVGGWRGGICREEQKIEITRAGSRAGDSWRPEERIKSAFLRTKSCRHGACGCYPTSLNA